DPPQDAHIYAKAPDRTRWRPPYAFRHELVSAFLLLERGARDRALDLAAYLVAAHHGKLRLTPRVLPDDHDPTVAVCLGVKEGDEVPEVVIDGLRLGPARIDLSLFRIGSLDEATWIERALDLLDRLGPFRLAYLEALLRVADQRASRREREESQ
ncbi:MAG: CRISPR-associated helicase/endonuclease Cas3, partial [Thermoleophilia bacterium]